MKKGLDALVQGWIETFAPLRELDLLPLLQREDGSPGLHHPWGKQHRSDWEARGLVIWPRGGQILKLRHRLQCPPQWRQEKPEGIARLGLRWWAEAAVLRVDGEAVVRGDLFDSACRWQLPQRFWQGEGLELELELQSPSHDEGALILARLEREPDRPDDPNGFLLLGQLQLLQKALAELEPQQKQTLEDALALEPNEKNQALLRKQLALLPKPGALQLLSHAHLDLAWLWPVADTWQAAVRTFSSVLALQKTNPELCFGHSTPALYHWLEQHKPQLFAEIRQAMQAGRWEPLNGPWVETDCTLVGSSSLLRQFDEGQVYSRKTFPEWNHNLAWLPDSFGFSAGLPAICAATGVNWFLTHKLFWNATNPFPHRLFRWRHPSGSTVLSLMSAPIGTDANPLAMAEYSRQWQGATGVRQGLWLPGVGDHGGGPSQEMLDQLAIWNGQALAVEHQFGTMRNYLAELEPLGSQLPVWRDELYLELHRACATSRSDQKRHNRSLERLLQEADLAEAFAAEMPSGQTEWRCLLFQQFHDILPGTSIPAVFEQAERQWCTARRQSRQRRDEALAKLLPLGAGFAKQWWVGQLLPAKAGIRLVKLPRPQVNHCWWSSLGPLQSQPAKAGGCWVQLPFGAGVEFHKLVQKPTPAGAPSVQEEIHLTKQANNSWLLQNKRIKVRLGPQGVEQLQGRQGDSWGPELLKNPLQWNRFSDRGEFWDAWDLAPNYRTKPLPFCWEQGPELLEAGPLNCQMRWRGRCGQSPIQLLLRLQAASEVLELVVQTKWQQHHELLRMELPLSHCSGFWSADCPGGVQNRPTNPRNSRERARWEAAAISWLFGGGTGPHGLAVLLDGPQGVSGSKEGLGVSLLRGPTWPDPGADHGNHRLRIGLMPAAGGWWQQGVGAAAARFRQPLWKRPAAGPETMEEIMHKTLLNWPDSDLQLLRVDRTEPDKIKLTAQNLSPCRSSSLAQIKPWAIGSWEVGAPEADQSS
jgi:alpha-mannosidase